MSIWSELRRRKIIRVGIGYAIAGWVLLQLISVLGSLIAVPAWIGKLAVLVVAIGFPVVLTLAWMFELTPKGLVRDRRRVEKRLGVRIDYVLLILVLFMAGWILHRFWPGDSVTIASAESKIVIDRQLRQNMKAPLKNSVAVLPFENLSPDPDNAFFAAGLHEEVLHQLAGIEDLRVISRKSVRKYEDLDVGIPQIAEELSVDSVMEGSARFSGNEVRIKAQLIDGVSDENLWAEIYQRELSDIFLIQADIAENIADQFKSRLHAGGREYAETRAGGSPQGIANYLHALSLDWGGPGDLDRALELLDAALVQDPDFASALALRALILATSLNNTPARHGDWQAQKLETESIALSDAELALKLDSRQARAYIALARVNQYRWRGNQARKAYEAGLGILPNDVDLLRGFAWFNSIARNHSYAIELAERAVEIDPMNAAAHAELGQRLSFAGQWDEAYSAHETALLLDPDNGVHHLRMANSEIAGGNFDQAIIRIRKAEALMDLSDAGPDLLAELAYAYSRTGDSTEARRVVDLMNPDSGEFHVGIGNLAMAMLALQRYPEALELLSDAASEIAKNGVLGGGFKSLAQISANVVADPALNQPEFRVVREQLTFTDLQIAGE